MEDGLEYITFYAQKHIAICSNLPLVRENRLLAEI